MKLSITIPDAADLAATAIHAHANRQGFGLQQTRADIAQAFQRGFEHGPLSRPSVYLRTLAGSITVGFDCAVARTTPESVPYLTVSAVIRWSSTEWDLAEVPAVLAAYQGAQLMASDIVCQLNNRRAIVKGGA